jgi:sarcosine oxidase / L-pipecolate oxidase
VTIVDRGPIPHPDAASTDITKAIRMEYGADALYTELMERALPLWREANDRYRQPLFHETGFALLASRPLEPGDFEHDSLALLSARGHSVERLDAAAIGRRFPCFRPGRFVDGTFNPRGGWADSAAVIEALCQDARRRGVAFVEATVAPAARGPATGVELASGDRIAADVVVVAAGTWSARLLPELDGVLHSVAQPVVHFAPTAPERFMSPRLATWGADIGRTGFYGFPATPAGIVKLANHGPGAPCDPDTPREDGADHLSRFRELVCDILPELASAPCVKQRVCLYSDTPDGDFWIDHHPDRPGLVVATGGSGHGFKFGPVIGEIVADVVERKSNPHAERFRWRVARGSHSDAARYQGDDLNDDGTP